MSDEFLAPGENGHQEIDTIEVLLSQYDTLSNPDVIREKARELAEEAVLNSDNELVMLTAVGIALGDITNSKALNKREVRKDSVRQLRGAALLDALESQIESAKLLYKRALPSDFLDADKQEIIHWQDSTKQIYDSTTRLAIGAHRKNIPPNYEFFRKHAFDRIRDVRAKLVGKVESDDEIRAFLNTYTTPDQQDGSLAMMQYAYPGVMELLRNVKVSIEQNTEPEDFLMHMRPLLYNRFDLWEQNKGLSEKELFELYRSIYAIALNNTAPGLELKKPKILIWQASRQESTPARQLPSILKDKKGENSVTLQSLFDMGLDTESAGWRLLDYMGNIPKGDLFIQDFTKEVLFFQPNSDATIDGNTFFGDKGQTKRIMELQLWLANKLIAPAFSGDLRDEKFDAQFSRMIKHMSSLSVHNLGKMLHRAIIAAPSTRAMFDKNRSGLSLVDDLPLTTFIDRKSVDDTTPRAAEMAFISLINQHAGDISQSLRTRYFVNYDKQMKPLENAFMLFVMPPIQPREAVVDVVTQPEVEANPVAEFLQSRLNSQLIEGLRQSKDQFDQITKQEWHRAKEGRKINYWLHPEGTYTLRFSHGSAMNLAGLRAMHVNANPEVSDEYNVIIDLDTDLPPITGVVSGEGRLVINEAKIPAELVTMIEHIAVLSIQSLVCRTRGEKHTVTSDELNAPTPESDQSKSDTDKTQDILQKLKTESQSPSKRHSPPALPIESHSSSGTHKPTRETDQIRESHWIGGSIHGSSYSLEFTQLVDAYNNMLVRFPDIAKASENGVRHKYKKMHKIRNEHWNKMPVHIREQIKTIAYPFDDPENNIKQGQQVPVTNWYRGHWTPSLGREKVVKPEKIHRQYTENFYGPLAYFHDWFMTTALSDAIDTTDVKEDETN